MSSQIDLRERDPRPIRRVSACSTGINNRRRSFSLTPAHLHQSKHDCQRKDQYRSEYLSVFAFFRLAYAVRKIMQLTGLNDDVLVHVFSYLHGKDALSVALASRRFHYLAVPRVSAVIQCRNYLVLPRLWSYLVATSPPRARHISHLEVDFPGMRSLSELHLKITHPLTDILTQARNIRVLFLYGFFLADLDMDSYTAFAGALHAMSSLSELSITFLHDDNLPALCASLPSSLRALSLGYISAWENKKHSYPPLLRVLTSLQNMCSLHLRGFKPRAGLGDMSPTFPSLLNLTFYDVSLPAVDLVSLAPNLQQVSVECEHTQQSQWFPHMEPWTEPPRPWPPVRRIEFNVMSSLTHFRDAFSSTADHLKITARTAPTRAGELLSILRVLSPLGADLYLTIGDDPAVFWREVADAAPRLRYLRLSLTVKSSAGSWTPWMVRPPTQARDVLAFTDLITSRRTILQHR